jgi:hypothetical protein
MSRAGGPRGSGRGVVRKRRHSFPCWCYEITQEGNVAGFFGCVKNRFSHVIPLMSDDAKEVTYLWE